MRSPVADLLADLGAAFAAVDVEWFLFGAQAAMVYGVARLTAGLEDEFFARANRHDLDGVGVAVVDVSDLIVMKVLASRAKDLEDVVTLLRVQKAAIDLVRTRSTLQMLEPALGQSDLLWALDQALTRVERR